MKPGGETEQTMNKEIIKKRGRDKRTLGGLLTDADIENPVGRGDFTRVNKRPDVIRATEAVEAVGVPVRNEPRATHSMQGLALIDAISDFQRREEGLDVDGTMNPGGPTQARLRQRLKEAGKLAPPPAVMPASFGPAPKTSRTVIEDGTIKVFSSPEAERRVRAAEAGESPETRQIAQASSAAAGSVTGKSAPNAAVGRKGLAGSILGAAEAVRVLHSRDAIASDLGRLIADRDFDKGTGFDEATALMNTVWDQIVAEERKAGREPIGEFPASVELTRVEMLELAELMRELRHVESSPTRLRRFEEFVGQAVFAKKLDLTEEQKEKTKEVEEEVEVEAKEQFDEEERLAETDESPRQGRNDPHVNQKKQRLDEIKIERYEAKRRVERDSKVKTWIQRRITALRKDASKKMKAAKHKMKGNRGRR